MVLKKVFVLFLCCTTAMAGTKKPLPQEVEAAEQAQTQAELEKWTFPGIIGGLCLLLLWHNQASKPVIAKPKDRKPSHTEQPAAQPTAAPQPPQNHQDPPNPPAPKPEIKYTTIEPMNSGGDIYEKVAQIYASQSIQREPSSRFFIPFTEANKKEFINSDLSTIELPKAWYADKENELMEIVIVADRRVPGKHSYAVFSTLENARDIQPVKDFFAVVEPGMG